MTQASKEPGDLGVFGLYRGTPVSYEFPLALPTDGDRIIKRSRDPSLVYRPRPPVEADFEVGRSVLCHLGGHF